MTRIFTPEFWRTFWLNALEVVTSRGLLILVILAGYWVARIILNRVIDGALARLLARQARLHESEERAHRLKTLQGLTKSITSYVLFFVLVIMLFDAFGANVMGLVTTAGVGGLAIGFGAQKLVRDVISGFFLIIEDQFAVGDYVTIGTATGVVEDLGMRITRLRDDQGRVWILSNGDITIVTNHSRAPVESFIEIGIAPGTDLKKARAAIQQASKSLYESDPGNLLDAPQAMGVSGWDAARSTIRVKIIAQPAALSNEQLRVREAILDCLNQTGIATG